MNPEPLLPVEGGSGHRGLRSLNDSQRVVRPRPPPALAVATRLAPAAAAEAARAQRSRRKVADTQQLGIGVIEQLGSQREVLHGAVERQAEMATLLARSSQLLRTMLRRANWIKAILLFIVGVLLLTIVLIGWHKWGGNHSPAAPEAAASTAARTVASTAAAAALHASAAASPDPPLLPAPAVAAPPGPRRLSEFDFSSENKPVGAGVIVIFVFGLLTLAALFLAAALRPVQRCAVSCGAVAVLGIVLAVLFLYPRDDGAEPTAGRTDTSSLMRALIAVLLLLTALAGPITILATHLAPAQAIRLPTDLAAFKEAEAA